MKKLLSLLSVLTISGTAVPTTIAASPYQKEKQLNRGKRDINQIINLINEIKNIIKTEKNHNVYQLDYNFINKNNNKNNPILYNRLLA